MEMIKNEVFKLVNFSTDIEISYEEFNGVKIVYDGKKATIGYGCKSDLARGYFLLAMNLSKSDAPFEICQKRHFKTLGAQLDVSRGGVPTIEALKKFIVKIAALGYNFLGLYMEDMFEMEKYPRFGYMRGRYSAEELRELDDFAYSFGVELVPAIEALAHLNQYFQWLEAAPLSNGVGSLLVDSEDTYVFIEEMIKTLKGIFRTNRIGTAMDEATAMFGGKYAKLHGTDVNKMEVFLRHLNRVVSICEKYGVKPFMSGDMFFWLTSKKGWYYDLDAEFSEELIASVPNNIEIKGWIYAIPHQFDMVNRGLTQEECFKIFLDKYKQLSKSCMYQGAIWTWDGFFEDSQFSLYSSIPALRNAIKSGFEEVIASSYGDGGQECNLLKQLPGMLPIYSEYCFRGLDCTVEDIVNVSSYFTGLPFENRMALMERMHGSFDETKDDHNFVLHYHDCQRLNKALFFSDILYDLADFEYDYDKVIAEYTEGADLCRKYIEEDSANKDYYEFCLCSFEVGIRKLEIFENLRKKYRENDMEYVKKVAYEYIPDIIKYTDEFYDIFEKNWDETNKSSGIELHQVRLGGVVKRAKYVAKKLDRYIKGEIDKVEELEQDVILSRIRMYSRNFHKVTTPNVQPY